MSLREIWVAAACGLSLAGALSGCGTPAAPQPPSLNLPERVGDLEAARAGNQVELNWTMPKRNTDRLVLKDKVRVRVCRQEGAAVCDEAGAVVSFAPGAKANFTDTLPLKEMTGKPRVLSYFVELKNHNGRSAGLSNPAVVLAGEAPAPVEALSAEVKKAGVVLHWRPDGEDAAVRLQRTLLTPTPAAKKEKEGVLAPPPEQVQQSLLIEDVSQGRALDKSIRFGETYAYRAQRVARVTVEDKTLELAGAVSDPVQVEAKDVFPPAVPAGLAAVTTMGGNGVETAIDLSWVPDSEADVAGYVVYRREGDGAWQRISPAEPVVGPAFHDAQVQPGNTYIYAVSAVDQGGHESARSAETSEAVPAQ